MQRDADRIYFGRALEILPPHSNLERFQDRGGGLRDDRIPLKLPLGRYLGSRYRRAEELRTEAH